MKRLECLLWNHTTAKRMIGMRTLKQNEILPPGWGICWQSDYYRDRVIAPWGLNLIYSLARAGYMQVQGCIPLRLSDWMARREDNLKLAAELEQFRRTLDAQHLSQVPLLRAIAKIKAAR